MAGHKTDQYRARATEYLDRMIDNTVASLAEHDGDTHCTFLLIVAETFDAIDPQGALEGPQGCALGAIAEQFAEAVITLAQTRQGAR